MAESKKRVAVFLGGRAAEHDISIVTGMQVLNALDADRYEGFPVYVDFDGVCWCGEALRGEKAYIPPRGGGAGLERVEFSFAGAGKLSLSGGAKGPFRGRSEYPFDIALPALHGAYGEDGGIQGLMEWFGVPYAGMRTMAASLFMDKVATKAALSGSGIGLLEHRVLLRPKQGLVIPSADLSGMIKGLEFPLIVKPVTLGSSIGVARVTSLDELAAALPAIFRLDARALVEPAVQNLIEYNVSVSRAFGDLRLSAIEKPKPLSEVLDFKEKYQSGGSGSKILGTTNTGLLSLTRDINPDLPAAIKKNIHEWSGIAFDMLAGSGAPRIDFLCDSKTSEVWLNEVNACPGSFGFFLWEAAEKQVLFPDFLSALLDEGFALAKTRHGSGDPVPADARLFQRKT